MSGVRRVESGGRVDGSAPGKMLIAGEYVVLRGAPAIACAVQRRALARWTDRSEGPDIARGLDHDTPRFPEAAAARLAAETELGVRITGELSLDVSALRTETTKLGVGSSAAAAAAAAAAVFASAGQELSSPEVRLSLLRCALKGHEAVAPRGSGVDVAASVMGGTIRYVRKPLKVASVKWPSALLARVVWTGKSASTREFLDRLDTLYHSDSACYGALMKGLEERTEVFAAAFEAADAGAVLRAVPELVVGLERLGHSAGAPIVEEKLIEIAAIAERHGGAAKPSGAGGGDVALAFFLDEASASAFAKEAATHDLEVLDVELGGPGAQAEP